MKLLKYLFLLCILPMCMKAALQDDLVRLQKSLQQLSNVFPKKETFIPEGKPTTLEAIEKWLLEAIANYKKDPFNFAQQISQAELNSVKNMLKEYIKKVVDKAEDDGNDIDIDSDIMNFMRISLEQKEEGGLLTGQSYYKVLNSNILATRYDKVRDLASKYIDSITQVDFSKPLVELRKQISSLAAQVPDLSSKKPEQLASIYHDMQVAIQKAELLMLPSEVNVTRVKNEAQNLKKYFQNVLEKAQESLEAKYKKLQKNVNIEKFQKELNELREKIREAQSQSRPENEIVPLQAQVKNTENKLRQLLNALLYQHSTVSFEKMVQACSDIQAIVNATEKDRDKLTMQMDVKNLCDNILSLKSIKKLVQELPSNPTVVAAYSKQQAEQAYNGIGTLIKTIEYNLGTIPSDLQKVIDNAKELVLNRLSNFKSDYEQAIEGKRMQIARAAGAAKPEYADVMAATDAQKNCNVLEDIYKNENKTMPEKIKQLCVAIPEIIKSYGKLGT